MRDQTALAAGRVWTRGQQRGPGFWGYVARAAKYLTLTLLAATFVLPFFWMATSALKTGAEIYSMPPVWFPGAARWSNYPNAWRSSGFGLYVINTVVRYAAPLTVAVTLSSAIVAYGFSRLRWPGRDTLFSLCLATMMVPGAVTMVPLFITFKHLGWLNTYLPLVAPGLSGSAYFIFMLRQFFLTIPEELSDAARIDGAGELGILFRIILPLARPALTVVVLFTFMRGWNDYLGPLIYINQAAKYPIALGIYNLRLSLTEAGVRESAYPYLMAVSTVVTLPILVAFAFAQRVFIEGISLTGIKG